MSFCYQVETFRGETVWGLYKIGDFSWGHYMRQIAKGNFYGTLCGAYTK